MLDVYLELGTKRLFAIAADWPGWARHANDEQSALAALVDYYDKRFEAGYTAQEKQDLVNFLGVL